MKRKSGVKDWSPPAVDEGSDSPEKFNPLSFDDLGRGRGPLSLADIVINPVTDFNALARAWERYRAPQKLKEALARIDVLETAERKRNLKSRGARLCGIIRAVKLAHPDQASDALFIASRVDLVLKEKKLQLHTVCPKSWHAPSDRLQDLLDSKAYPGLYKRVKSYMSRA